MNKLGIYIHIPFCKSKCKYCDFVSFSCSTEKMDRYFEYLIKEIENKEIKNIDDKIISTIYIGGGTPSFLESKYIVKTLDVIKKRFKIEENAEITIEINPGTITKQKLLDIKM